MYDVYLIQNDQNKYICSINYNDDFCFKRAIKLYIKLNYGTENLRDTNFNETDEGIFIKRNMQCVIREKEYLFDNYYGYKEDKIGQFIIIERQ